MEQKSRVDLLEIMYKLYEKPSEIVEHWENVTPLLAELTATAPLGFEGMAMMISNHLTNATQFKDSKVQKFELESGLKKLHLYFRKLNSFEKI